MDTAYGIVERVYAAKSSDRAADDLVRDYLPFIKSETAKFLGRAPEEGRDDEFSIAMFAFHETVLAYERNKGAFLPLAAKVIKHRLIDYRRSERRHSGYLSLDEPVGDDSGRTLADHSDLGYDNIEETVHAVAARDEISHFAMQLMSFGLTLGDIAENSPKQERTLYACKRALDYARENPELLDRMLATGKVPLTELSEGSGVEKKTLERHRRYLVAILLAYTNGFEIIRGHLSQIAPRKEERR